jgi:nucleotide-binding universal stress UspA family protein
MTLEARTRVLAGFDGSDDAYVALSYAIAEAKHRDADLVLAHAIDDIVLNSAWGVVFDPEEIKLNAAEMLARAVDDAVAAGLDRRRVHTEVVLGNPAAGLTKLSQDAAVVIVGRRSSEQGDKPFVGSTTLGVVGAAHAPVISVSTSDDPHELRTGVIGVGVDTSARGADALRWALAEAKDHGGRVVVMSVCRVPSGRWLLGGQLTVEQQDAAIEVTRQRVSELVDELSVEFPDVPVELEVSCGSPLDVLTTRSADLDLLVLEVHASFPTYSVGGLIRGLLAHGRCPIGTITPR